MRPYVPVEDFTHVKFHRRSLRAAVELEEGPFDGFKRLVAATGPNPLPR